VTGANAGIGKAIAMGLASRGGQVHMLCRSQARGIEAKENIVKDTGNEDVHLHVVDLSEPAEIKAFVKDFKKSHKKLDVLVNNVAVGPDDFTMTSGGMESAFATNLVGFYGLTKELAPMLSGGRIVNLVSAGMFLYKLHTPSLHNKDKSQYKPLENYCQHHRGRVMLTEHFAKTLEGEVTVNSVHPGWVDTPGLAGAKAMEGFYRVMQRWLRSEEEGADTALWLAISERASKFTGRYFFDRWPRATHKW